MLDTGRPFTADRFAAARAADAGRPRYVSLVPTQLHRVLADPDATAALATFDAVLVGGAADPAGAARRPAGRGPGGHHLRDERDLRRLRLRRRAAGRVTVDRDATASGWPAGSSLAGPVVARGYRGRPGDPAFASTRRHPAFRTDDLGRLVDGRWRCSAGSTT